jgi:type I restriction enzyme, R subunit
LDKKEKAANILFALNRLVLVDRHRSPVYESLVDKVERLLEMWREKTKDYKKIYLEGSKVFQDMKALTDRKASLGFSDLEYALLLELEKILPAASEGGASVKTLSVQLERYLFPGWHHQATIRKDIEREVRKFTRGIKNQSGLSIEQMNELHDKLMNCVKNYGSK